MVIKVFILFGIYILIGIGVAIVFERYGDGWIDDGDILWGILGWPIMTVILMIELIIWIVRKAGGQGL